MFVFKVVMILVLLSFVVIIIIGIFLKWLLERIFLMRFKLFILGMF